MIQKNKITRQITLEKLRQVEQAISEGMSQYAIAKKFKVGNETIARIRDGSHHLQQQAIYFRCRSCGGMVILPCRACQLRAASYPRS
jgi:IS30 family transposase